MPWTIYPCCGFEEYQPAIAAARSPVCPECKTRWRNRGGVPA